MKFVFCRICAKRYMGFVIGFVVRNGLGLLLGLGFLSAFVAHKAHMEREKHDVEFRCGMSPAGRRPQLFALKLAGSSRSRNIKNWDRRIGTSRRTQPEYSNAQRSDLWGFTGAGSVCLLIAKLEIRGSVNGRNGYPSRDP